MPDYSFADLLDGQAVLGDNGAVFLSLNGSVTQFDMSTGNIAWTSDLVDDIKFQTDENHIVAQGGDKLYDLGLVQTASLSMPTDLYGSTVAFGPREAPNSTLMFDSTFEATLLAEGLNGTISHYAADSYLMNSADGSAGVAVQPGKIEGGSVQKTPDGKVGAPTDPDTVSELRLVPVSDCVGQDLTTNNYDFRRIVYKLQKPDGNFANGKWFVTEHQKGHATGKPAASAAVESAARALACKGTPAEGTSTDFGETITGVHLGREFDDKLGGNSGSYAALNTYQTFTIDLKYDGDSTLNPCAVPETGHALTVQYPTVSGVPAVEDHDELGIYLGNSVLINGISNFRGVACKYAATSN